PMLAWENSAVEALPAATAPHLERISGLIERVTFFNEDSGFCVLRVKAPGHRDLVTVVGSSPSVCSGEWLTADGTWVREMKTRLHIRATVLRPVWLRNKSVRCRINRLPRNEKRCYVATRPTLRWQISKP